MRKVMGVMVLLAALLGMTAAAPAQDAEEAREVTLTGKLLCARCALKEDLKGCQSALLVEGDGGGVYYLENNGAAEQFGHPCEGKWDAEVTGTLSERDGKTWVTARKIVDPKKKG